MASLQLYHVADDGPTPEPREWDLFVWAHGRDEAIKLWQGYYDTTEKPHRVDEIPDAQREGTVAPHAIAWDSVPCVWIDNERSEP